jgi:putative membrane protein
MLVRLLIAWAVVAAAIGLAAALLDSVSVNGGLVSLLWVSLVFALVHALLGPILRLISAPITVITLGLFSLVVNGILLAITAGLTNSLDVGGFLGVIVAAFVISAIEAVLGFVLAKLMPATS